MTEEQFQALQDSLQAIANNSWDVVKELRLIKQKRAPKLNVIEKVVNFPETQKVELVNPPPPVEFPEFPKLEIPRPELVDLDPLLESNEKMLSLLSAILVSLNAPKEETKDDGDSKRGSSTVIHTKRAVLIPETPTGLIDGVNTVFYLARAPRRDQFFLFLNSAFQTPGEGKDYTIRGNQITYALAPEEGSGHFTLQLKG